MKTGANRISITTGERFDWSDTRYIHYRDLAIVEARKARQHYRTGQDWLAASCAKRAAKYRRNAINFADTTY